MKLGLGLGLGLGIPLVLLLAGLLGYLLLRRRRRYGSIKSQTPSEHEMHHTGTPTRDHKEEMQHQVHEVDGQHGVYEAPSEGAHEAGSVVRYEMSAEKDKD